VDEKEKTPGGCYMRGRILNLASKKGEVAHQEVPSGKRELPLFTMGGWGVMGYMIRREWTKKPWGGIK